ncbi:hypothetical protein K502DRAFT_331825 [Neoconidiobolus thromboides FSU 785]|nr:hypothetical protein K502DRAFT_331825 [Neoconidiobolus thromboides FSU 785]
MNELEKEIFLTTANIALEAKWEREITGLAFALLRFSGLDPFNGYFIKSGIPINDYDSVGTAILIKTIKDKAKVLVIMFILDKSELSRSSHQLEEFMQEKLYPNGILMAREYSTIFELDTEAYNTYVVEVATLNNLTDIDKLLSTFKKMRVDERA